MCVCVCVCLRSSDEVLEPQGGWRVGHFSTEDDTQVLYLQLSFPVGKGPSYYAIFQELLDPAFCFSGCLLP